MILAGRLQLNGLRVLVTRPQHQADGLCQLLTAQGGVALHFPTISIQPSRNADSAAALLEQARRYDWVIFVSVNAVYFALEACKNRHLISPRAGVVAIGQATMRALRQCKIGVDVYPKEQFNSESLLALPQMLQVHGQQVLIVRGEGGRELIADSLRARGAVVDYAEVYRRSVPETGPREGVPDWIRDGVDAVTITSTEALGNLLAMTGDAGVRCLQNVPVVVASPRIAGFASARGLNKVIVAAGAGDSAILDAVSGLVE